MKRTVDLQCEGCEAVRYNVLCDEREKPTCPNCNFYMTQCWWGLARPKQSAQWDDNTAVMVFKDPATGKVSYPGRHDAKQPKGYERVYLRSLREVEQFEKQQNVRSEVAWFDRGTGRGNDDEYRGQRMTH